MRTAPTEGYPGVTAVSPFNRSSAVAVPSNTDLSGVEAQAWPDFDVARAVETTRRSSRMSSAATDDQLAIDVG
ncbi:hypothetical protein ABID59_006176 [Bradyrhizobium sp. S3.3.6]|uniref:hypothetical protein n=1 Tax=Bradyrhizobium sp. S3.3.6 TaxID=3156429 RepID=UPI0033975A46